MSTVRAVNVIAAILLLCAAVVAQTSKGFVTGMVVDPNGAGVPGATLKITNQQTGVVRETVTREDGSYRLDAVDPGSYVIEASSTGFSTAKQAGIEVRATQTVEVMMQLEVGATSAEVTVVAESGAVLQTSDGSRVNTLDQREITELPALNLNPVNLVFTLPGVTDVGGASGSLAGGFTQGPEFSINGLRPRSNNQLIDGLDNNDNSITGQSYQPGVRDAYSEVTVLGSDYSAEFGRAGGAVVNVITRSGTNDFHGSFYDIIQNSALNALTPAQRASGLTKPPQFTQNTFGGSFGGPVVRNKLFFFGTAQADPVRSSTTSTAVVPTEAGFNQLRALFPPGTNPNVDRYLEFIGAMRGTTNVRTFGLGGDRPAIEFGTATRVSPQPVDTYDYVVRLDWTPNTRDSFAFRYLANDQIFANQILTGGSQFDGFEVDVPSLTQNFFATHTRVFSPTTTNEFRFGYGRVNVIFGPRDPSKATSGPQFLFAGTTISTVGLGPGFPQGRIFNNFQFQDTVTHSVGNHTLRIGADILVQRAKQFVPINTRGQLTFAAGGGFTTLGNFVDAFSGVGSGAAAKVFGSGVTYPDTTNHAYFINDTWKVTPELTLNLGLRYENFGLVANNAPFPAFAGFDTPLLTRVALQRDNNNFGPRVSFAYAPKFEGGLGRALFGPEGVVLRGGFAVNYDVFFNNMLSNLAANAPNALGTTLFGANVGGRGIPDFTVAALPANPVQNPQAAQQTLDPGLHNPKTYVWNLGIQREVFGGNILDLAYVGSRGIHLFINEQFNPGDPNSPHANGRVFGNRGTVIVRTNGGDSNYHSLQARMERSFRGGFHYRLAYTFSKAIDNTNSEIFVTTGGASVGSDHGNRRADRSRTIYDTPHVLSLTALYDTSSLFKTGTLRHLLGGFRLAGVYRYQSGNVETPYISGFDLNGDLSATNDRPAISNPNASPTSVAFANEFAADFDCDESATGYFDVGCNPTSLADSFYVVDSTIRTGIAGRNSLRAPGYNRLDLSLTRSFDVFFTPFESDRFEVRFDLFNATNTPPFRFEVGGVSDGDVTNANFNRPELNSGISVGNSQARSGRIQLRYVF